jgi:hypothetical protein
MRHLALYESSTRNATSCTLREQYKKCDISHFTRAVQEVQHAAVYESSTRNAISRRLREQYRKCKILQFTTAVQEMRLSRRLREQHNKCDIPPFTTETWEMWYLAVYESSTRSAISRRLREQHKKCDISPFTRPVQTIGYFDIHDISTRNKIRAEEGSDCIQTAKKLLRIIKVIAERTPHKFYALLLDKMKVKTFISDRQSWETLKVLHRQRRKLWAISFQFTLTTAYLCKVGCNCISQFAFGFEWPI